MDFHWFALDSTGFHGFPPDSKDFLLPTGNLALAMGNLAVPTGNLAPPIGNLAQLIEHGENQKI